MAGDPEPNLLWGKSLNQHTDASRGACRKCGYVGHLAFQCRNFIKIKSSNQDIVLDVSSTSSESEGETPLQVEAKKDSLKRKKEMKKKHHKRRRSEHSTSSDSEEDKKGSSSREKKHKKKKHRKEKDHKKQRSHEKDHHKRSKQKEK